MINLFDVFLSDPFLPLHEDKSVVTQDLVCYRAHDRHGTSSQAQVHIPRCSISRLHLFSPEAVSEDYASCNPLQRYKRILKRSTESLFFTDSSIRLKYLTSASTSCNISSSTSCPACSPRHPVKCTHPVVTSPMLN
jgi:hypothetical protein